MVSAIKNGAIVNILFAGFIFLYEFVLEKIYFAFAGGVLETKTKEVIYGDKTDFLLGLTILVALVAEFIGILIKCRKSSGSPRGDLMIILWFFHLMSTTFIVMTACKAFGTNMEDPGSLAITLILVNIVKEVIILGFLFRKKPAVPQSYATAILADTCILFFYCVSFSTGWDVIAATPGANLHAHLGNIPLLVLYTIMSALFFCLLYLPLRLGYYISESAMTKKDRAISIVSTLVVVSAAILPLYQPLTS